ncbi:hypothetical protein FJT64_015227 [Amphibalanus amphitrite]|uniref:Uncharacterized protein n=1 Tax=Amphibalanus amphitrite TaxID=1232801 RepID=A0A6A4XE30_AMPAM|nr:hypothetical protein FJT64_015227 [Amphibalanus amphitrite]
MRSPGVALSEGMMTVPVLPYDASPYEPLPRSQAEAPEGGLKVSRCPRAVTRRRPKETSLGAAGGPAAQFLPGPSLGPLLTSAELSHWPPSAHAHAQAMQEVCIALRTRSIWACAASPPLPTAASSMTPAAGRCGGAAAVRAPDPESSPSPPARRYVYLGLCVCAGRERVPPGPTSACVRRAAPRSGPVASR